MCALWTLAISVLTVAPERSPEIEAVAQRVLMAYLGDFLALGNLMSGNPILRVLGFDEHEWWKGLDEFLSVREAQVGEAPDVELYIDEVEGFEDGQFGWVTLFSRLVAPEAETRLRHTAVLRMEAGAWRVVHWHNSSPVANQQVYGVDLTKTLHDLVASILDEGGQFPVDSTTEGTMTLVFSDIVDSTRLAESVGDSRWAEIVRAHESAIRAATSSQGGTVVKFLGDGSMLAFESARAALRTAIQIQNDTDDAPFAVRIGVHSGEVMRTADDILGLTVNKAARVAAAAGEGEILISSTTKDLIGRMEGVEMGEARMVTLKGISGPHQIVPVEWT